jgi:hypothetical protein
VPPFCTSPSLYKRRYFRSDGGWGKENFCVLKKKVNEADCLLRVSIDRHGSRSYLCLQNWPRAEKKIAQCRRACLLQWKMPGCECWTKAALA